MKSSRIKNSISTLKLLLCLMLLISNIKYAYSNEYTWELLGPGDADQITSVNILSNGDIVVGLDIGGLYISTNNSKTWHPINNGLNNLDVTTKVIQDHANKNTLYVGTRGGLYKSINYGKSWLRLSNGLPEPAKHTLSGSIGGILIDSTNSKVIYAAMGYRPSSEGTITVQKIKWINYIYKSVDAGASWTKHKAFSSPSKVTQLYQSPAFKNMLYAATESGLYISESSGDNWKSLLNKHTLNIAIPHNQPNVIYAACNEDGIMKSYDNGKTWKLINNGLSFFNYSRKFNNRYSTILLNPKNESQIFVLNSTWGKSGGLYVSNNEGGDWQHSSKNMPESWLKTSTRMNDVAISNTIQQTLVMGSSRYIYTSNDSGMTWQQNISTYINDGWAHTGINIFGQTRVSLPSPSDVNTIYIGTADHGLLTSINNGISWNQSEFTNAMSRNIWDISICPVEPYTLHMATSSNDGTLCTMRVNSGVLNQSCSEFGNSGRNEKIAASPHDCRIVMLATNQGLYRSTDAGNTWNKVSITSKMTKVNTVAFDKLEKKRVYAGTADGLFLSMDEGMSWKKIKIDTNASITAIHISGTQKGTIHIGTEQDKVRYGYIIKSTDNGITWKRTLDKISKYVTAIEEIPGSNGTLVSTTVDHNYHDISKGSGAFISYDRGDTWAHIDNDLPVARAYNINVSPNHPGEAFMSTAGSGTYRLNLLK